MEIEHWAELLWPAVLAVSTLAAATSAIIHVLLSKRSTQSAIAWIGLIVLLPLLGAFAYLLFGINRIRRKANALRARRISLARDGERQQTINELGAPHACAPDALPTNALAGLARLAERVTQRALLDGNSIELLRDGEQAYPAMLEAIASAEKTISLSVYIFNNDPAGQRFIDALVAAHERGVKVHVIVDSIGAYYAFPPAAKILRKAGIAVALFMPILRPGSFAFLNLRTHRKILVVDGKLGFTGGINIRHEHMVTENKGHATHDTHFRVEGPLVNHLQLSNLEDWHFCTGEVLLGEEYFPELEQVGDVSARGIIDGPDEDYESLHWVLLAALATANERVVIITPYFLPDETLLDALQVTAMRGVQVDIILPQKSNLFFIDHASRPNWAPLLEHGCSIWLTPAPFDHSKLMVVDGVWSLLGSANWDPRSLRLNFEFNVEAYNEGVASSILELAEQKLQRARRVTLEDYESRGIITRLRDGLFRLMTPYL
jgi:cardiolipin synthase